MSRPETTTIGMSDLAHLMKSLSCVPSDDRIPQALRDGADEIERLRAEVADLRISVLAFGAPAMAERAREMGLPRGHLFPHHYDILKAAGARMDDFTRSEVEGG